MTDKHINIGFTIERAQTDKEARTVPLSFSSDTVLADNISGATRLVHTPDAIDMTRARDGIPLTFGTHKGAIVGRVNGIKLDGGKLRGLATISRNEQGENLLRDIEDGIVTDVSVGANVLDWEMGDDDTINVTRWQPYEVTTGAVVADTSIGINRTAKQPESKIMSDTDTTKDAKPATVVDLSVVRDAATEEGKRIERERFQKDVAEINKLFAMPRYAERKFQALKDALIQRAATPDQARDELLKMVGGDSEPLAGSVDVTAERAWQQPNGATIDQHDKFLDIAEKTLAVRVMTERDKDVIAEVRASEYGGLSVEGIARDFLSRNRIDMRGLSREQLIGKAMQRAIIGHSTSDFANVLENVANKSMLLGYEESPETWSMIARTISVPDFKSNSFVGLSEFGSLPEVKENGEYTYGSFADRKESAQLATYGQLFSISRQALANDDLDSLGTVPRAMGRAASRTIGDKVYAVLTSNPTLNQDSTTLFHANHSNLVGPGSGAAPSVTTLDAARVAMATQKDQSSSTTSLNIRPSLLIVPAALETTANILMTAQNDPATGGSATGPNPNPFVGTMAVVADARLDDDDAAQWYVSANPNITDTLGACFLNGQTSPFLDQQSKLEVDGLVYKVRIDCVALALDYRGLYQNDGN